MADLAIETPVGPEVVCGSTRLKAGTAPVPETDAEGEGLSPVWRVTGGKGRSSPGKAFVDYQNDVTDKDVELAARETRRLDLDPRRRRTS